MDIKSLKTKSKNVWIEYEAKIVLFLGVILIAIVSFEVGTLKTASFSQKPLIIEKQAAIDSLSAGTPAQAQNLAPENKIDPANALIPPANCTFIGSKNSNKYHLPTCRYAKGIKPENRTCFSSADEAQSKGYVPDKNCIK